MNGPSSLSGRLGKATTTADGKPLRCSVCDSAEHLWRRCPTNGGGRGLGGKPSPNMLALTSKPPPQRTSTAPRSVGIMLAGGVARHQLGPAPPQRPISTSSDFEAPPVSADPEDRCTRTSRAADIAWAGCACACASTHAHRTGV